MRKTDITTPLKSRLEQQVMAERSWVGMSFPNVRSAAVRPYLAVFFIAADRSAESLQGEDFRAERGRMQVQVRVDKDRGTDEADGLADFVAGIFPAGLRLRAEGTHKRPHVTISGPPEIRGGFATDTDWIVPVVVPYIATFA